MVESTLRQMLIKNVQKCLKTSSSFFESRFVKKVRLGELRRIQCRFKLTVCERDMWFCGDFHVFSRTFHLFEEVAKGADLSSRPVDLGKLFSMSSYYVFIAFESYFQIVLVKRWGLSLSNPEVGST